MMHKTDSGLRPYYLTHEFTIHDAPFDDIKKLEKSFNEIKVLNFENIEILKDV